MKLDTYTKALAACLSGTKKVDCAYIMYTTTDSAPEITDFNSLVLDDTHGVARTKSIILSDVSDDITFTLTSHKSEVLGQVRYRSHPWYCWCDFRSLHRHHQSPKHF